MKFLSVILSTALLTLPATPASARNLGERVEDFPAEGWALMALNAADFGTTAYCLHEGLCHEANPSLTWAIGEQPSDGKLAAAFAVTSVLNFTMITLVQDRSPGMARTLAIGGTILKGGVTAANLRFAF